MGEKLILPKTRVSLKVAYVSFFIYLITNVMGIMMDGVRGERNERGQGGEGLYALPMIYRRLRKKWAQY